MRQFILLASILLLISNVSNGQDKAPCNQDKFEDQLLENLTGSWFAKGTVDGDNVGYNIAVQWVLNHQFLEMSLTDTARLPQYTAKVFIGYDCSNKRYVAHLMDNFGGQFSEILGYGTKTGASVDFRFDYPQGPLNNKFIYNAAKNSWQFHSITTNDKGQSVVFGDIHLEKR